MPNRIIKESICTSEELAEISADAERLFFRLIVKADDFGIYHSNSKIINGTCFPLLNYTDKKIENMLDELYKVGLIAFAQGEDGKRYIKLTTWLKHQQKRADKSKFPHLIAFDIKNKQLISNVLENENENENVIENDICVHSTTHNDIINLFNQICFSFPKCTKLSENRKRAINARINAGYQLDDFKMLFEKAENSKFLKGSNNRNWIATFDWLIKDANMAKTLDGNYDDSNSKYKSSTNPYVEMVLNNEKRRD